MAKTAATRLMVTDPAKAKQFETAPFWEGEGASVGGAEIVEGVMEGDGDGEEEDDDKTGDGGELTAEEEGEGAVAVGVDDEVGDDTGPKPAGGEVTAFGDAAGEVAGDCATAETTHNAVARIRNVTLE